jgi:hypothetical protein
VALRLEDEKVRSGYERTLREVKRDIERVDMRPGTGDPAIRSWLQS